MATTSHHYVLILCGGTGPRLWPLSRASYPKQFLKIFGDRSFLQETYHRYRQIVPPSHIFIVSNAQYKSLIRQQLPQLPTSHLLLEPEKKNTAMAIVYGCSQVQRLDPEAIITSAPADHFISPLTTFSRDLSRAVTLASSTPNLVTLGIPPDHPDPSYGYILPSGKFHEKPSVTDAALLIKRGALWNSGIYTFSLATILNLFQLHQPTYLSLFQQLLRSTSLQAVYHQSDNLSIDHAISEKTDQISLIKANFSWSDVGEWHTIWQKLVRSTKPLVNLTPSHPLVQVNSKNCLVHGQKNKLVGLVGLNNLAIIDTPDALLVCHLNDSFSVRDLVAKIVSHHSLKKYFLKHS